MLTALQCNYVIAYKGIVNCRKSRIMFSIGFCGNYNILDTFLLLMLQNKQANKTGNMSSGFYFIVILHSEC